MTDHAEETYDYIFGFGSIMNTTTHAPWLQGHSSNEKVTALPAAVVTLKKSFVDLAAGLTPRAVKPVLDRKFHCRS